MFIKLLKHTKHDLEKAEREHRNHQPEASIAIERLAWWRDEGGELDD